MLPAVEEYIDIGVSVVTALVVGALEKNVGTVLKMSAVLLD